MKYYKLNREYPDVPAVIIKYVEQNDLEMPYYSIPHLFLKSLKQLETLKPKYKYEVYLIGKNGKLKLNKKYSTI